MRRGALAPWRSDWPVKADASSYAFSSLLLPPQEAAKSAAAFVASASLHLLRWSWSFLGVSLQNSIQAPHANMSPRYLQMWEQPEGAF